MVALNINSNIRQVQRRLNTMQQRQIPFALSVAMGSTVTLGRRKAIRSATIHLDRPVPSVTEKAFRKYAPRKNQVYTNDAKVFVAPWIAKEYRDLVYGDTVSELNGKTIISPVNAGLNQFGNVQGLRGRNGLLKRIRRAEEIGFEFLEVPLGREADYNGLAAGLYEKIGVGEFADNLNMLFAYRESRTYRRQWPLDTIVREEFARVFPNLFFTQVRQQLRQAR